GAAAQALGDGAGEGDAGVAAEGQVALAHDDSAGGRVADAALAVGLDGEAAGDDGGGDGDVGRAGERVAGVHVDIGLPGAEVTADAGGDIADAVERETSGVDHRHGCRGVCARIAGAGDGNAVAGDEAVRRGAGDDDGQAGAA